MTATLGHRTIGSGPIRMLVTNDWLSDTSSWDSCLPLIDQENFTWALADLRGYGLSRGIRGDHGLIEAATDLLRVADALDWPRFSVCGHSMSSLVALYLGQTCPERIERIVLVAPPPPAGLEVDEATYQYLKGLAEGDRDERLAGLAAMWGDRLSPRWCAFKAARWDAAVTPEAAAAFVDMFACRGLPEPARTVSMPVLAITGEEDAEIMRQSSVLQQLSSLCPDLSVRPIAESGHYPMQEAPPLTYTMIEQFLTGAAS